MKGFFNKEQIEDKNAACLKCKLFKNCESPRMKVTGKGRKGILVIAEAPGEAEDEQGVQLIGDAGQVLRAVLEGQGIDLDKDCWKTNAICCRPPKNRTPTKNEIKYCHPNVVKALKKKPHLVILLGATALESFIGNRLAEAVGGINRWRGFIIPDQRYKTWVAPTYHPSYILRNQGDKGEKIIEDTFERDIKKCLKMLKKKVPKHGDYKINILTTERETIDVLSDVMSRPSKLLSFDYETTGIKPYTKGHKIICSGISRKENEGHVFQLDNETIINWWKQILKDKYLKKTAQNIKFEQQWGRNILGVRTRGWKWDTMQASHILDNRKGINNLKFQSYINFGQEDYSSHLDKFLKTKKGVEFNKIHEAPLREVMEYCGMDAILEFKLAKKQMEKLL